MYMFIGDIGDQKKVWSMDSQVVDFVVIRMF